MDLKSFVVGAVCGGLVYAGVSAVLTDRPSFQQAENAGPTVGRDANSPSRQPAAIDRNLDSSLPDRQAETTFDRPLPISSESQSKSPGVIPVPTNFESSRQPVNGPSDSPQSSSDSNEPTGQQQSWFPNRRADLMEESKDDSWAYFMEQAILQFLANHSAMPEFTLEYIECRSTKCQIGVAGYDESTGPTWQRVMYDMRQQPWYEFGQVGTSWGDVDGRFMTMTELHRLPAD